MKVYSPAYQSVEETPLAIFLEQCGSGVNIFFFISGFILALPFLNSYVYGEGEISLKHYYYRRLTRIEPPYVISLTFFLIVNIIILHQPFSDSINHYLASAFYSHNIIYNHISTINPVAWSLEIEVQYYLIAPLIAVGLFFKNTLLRTVALATLFMLCSILYFKNFSFFENRPLSKSLLAYSSIFVTGIILADWYLRNKTFLCGKKSLLFDILALVALYYIIIISGFADLNYRIFIFACYFFLFLGAFKGWLLNKLLTNKTITTLGGMCYSIYLMHYAVTFFITQTFTKNIFTYNYPIDIFTQFLIITPFILIVSIVFFVLLERPFMDINWPGKMKILFQKFYSDAKL